MSTDGEASSGSWTMCPPADATAVSQYVWYVSRYGPTQLLQLGIKSPVTDIPANPFHGVKRIVFFIPGNPGPVALYRHFLTRLHESLGIPVIALSHVGMIREGIGRFKAPLTVRKLVEHKIDFIENVIPEDVEIVLVGHSLGTFISMQMMRLITKRERFVHNIMLMPVLEKFAQTPGWKSLRFMMHFRGLLYVLIALLSVVKDEIVVRLLSHLCPDLKKSKTPECVYEGSIQLVNWRVVQNILTLSEDESRQIQERDDYFLHKHLPKFSLFYCADDRWSPINLYRGLKRRFPDCFVELMDTVSHAFVMDKKMTEDVVERIVQRLEAMGLASSMKELD